MNNHPTLVSLMWIIGLVIVTLVTIIVLRRNAERWKKVGKGLTSGLSGFWEDEKKKTYKAMVIVALCILLLNLICSTVGWHWWANVWAKKSAFWSLQFGLFLSVLATALSDKKPAKIFAAAVTITVLCGIIWLGFGPTAIDPDLQAVAPATPAVAMIDKVIAVPVSTDSEIYDPLTVVDVTSPGRKVYAHVFGDGVPTKPLVFLDNQHINLPHGTLRVRFRSEDGPLQIIIRVPKDS